jgi:predicted MPP superfamily phosphohydrolase
MYACLGNHELIANVEAISMCLEACNVRVLVNDACELPAPWQGVWIAGTDDHRNGTPRPDATIAKTPRDACRILLAHEPDICESNAPARCSLTICGHTHGGQICLPGGRPLYVPGHSKWSRQYHAGLFRHAGHWLFVSRGVGTVGFPMRLWCPPEIAVFDFVGRQTPRVK